MIKHGLEEPSGTTRVSPHAASAIYALYWRDTFLGSCFAIADSILISAGHHYNASKDDVGDFSVLVGPSRWSRIDYAAKNGSHDVLVLWLSVKLENFISLRGYLPPLHSRVATVWLSPKPPHDYILSPGVVVESSANTCLARGTVSTRGSSGAPVIDLFGDNIVGMHLTSNTRAGSRVSGFISARRLVSLLAEMGIACRQPT